MTIYVHSPIWEGIGSMDISLDDISRSRERSQKVRSCCRVQAVAPAVSLYRASTGTLSEALIQPCFTRGENKVTFDSRYGSDINYVLLSFDLVTETKRTSDVSASR